MRCTSFREAFSARLDGEDAGQPDALVDAHLAGCAPCRAWVEDVGRLTDVVRHAPAHHVALDPAVLATLTAPPDRGRSDALSTRRWRIALGVVAVAQFLVSVTGLVLTDGRASVHVAHELTAWDMGLGVGFLVAAILPARAWGMLPLTTVLVACMVATSAIDLLSGHAVLGRELVHILEVAGLAIVWVLARRIPRPSVVVRLA
jgi:predicted anti-sigma-YlaC factor YlaD